MAAPPREPLLKEKPVAKKNKGPRRPRARSKQPSRKHRAQPTGRIGGNLPPGVTRASKDQVSAAKLIQQKNLRAKELQKLAAEMTKNAALTKMLAETQEQAATAYNQLANIAIKELEASNVVLFEELGLGEGDRITDEISGLEGYYLVKNGVGVANTSKKKAPVADLDEEDDEFEDEFDDEFIDEIEEDDEFEEEEIEEEAPVSTNA